MKDSKTVRILKLVADDVAAFFPYFFGFWLISICVSIFFPAWRDYFNWPAFDLSVLFFALLSLWSDTVQNFWKGVKDASRKGGEKGFEVFARTIILGAALVPIWKKILSWQKGLRRSDYYKIVAMVIVLGLSLFQGIYVVDFFVLLFGLTSVLFGLDMRISAGCALTLLILCPFLLIFNQNGFAETAAVYAYYFLVIAVFTAVGDHLREGKKVMHRDALGR
jgi:hypothetical protein